MADTCLVTGTARNSSFSLLPFQTVVFRPFGPSLVSSSGDLLVRTTIVAVADASAEISQAVVPGEYILETQADGGLVSASCVVPNEAAATLADCIAAASVPPTPDLIQQAFDARDEAAASAASAAAIASDFGDLDAAMDDIAAAELAAETAAAEALASETVATAARDAALLSRGVFASTAAGLSNGVASVTVTAAGSGGADGNFALAFSGGAGVDAAGTFTVVGGAVVSVTLTNLGTGYTSAPTASFAASSGLTGATTSVAIAARSPVGSYFSVPAAGDDSLILYRVDAGPAATEVARYPASAAEARGRRVELSSRRRATNRFQAADLEARITALENRVERAVQGATVIHCDPTAVGSGDGSSWANAFTSLTAAFAALPAGGILRTNSTEANPLAAPVANITTAPSNILWETDQGAAGETWISGAQKGTWTDAGGGIFSIALAAEPRYVAYDFKRDDQAGTVTGIDLNQARIARAIREGGLKPADVVAWYGCLRRNSPFATTTPAEGCWGYTGGMLYINPPGTPVLADVHSRAQWSDGRAGLAVTAAVTGWTIRGKMTVIFTPSDSSGEGYSLRFTAASRCSVEGVRSILSGYHSVGFAGTSGGRNVIRDCVTVGYCPGGIPYVFYTSGPALPRSGCRVADSAVFAFGPLDTLGVPISLTHGARTSYSHAGTSLSGVDYSRLLQIDFTGQQEVKHSVAFSLSPGFVSAEQTGDVLDQAIEESWGIKARGCTVLGKNAYPETGVSHIDCEFDRLGYGSNAVDMFSMATVGAGGGVHSLRLTGCRLRMGEHRYIWSALASNDSAALIDCDVLIQATATVSALFQVTEIGAAGRIILRGNLIDATTSGRALITENNTVFAGDPFGIVASQGGNVYGANVTAPVRHTNGTSTKTVAEWLAGTDPSRRDVAGLSDMGIA